MKPQRDRPADLFRADPEAQSDFLADVMDRVIRTHPHQERGGMRGEGLPQQRRVHHLQQLLPRDRGGAALRRVREIAWVREGAAGDGDGRADTNPHCSPPNLIPDVRITSPCCRALPHAKTKTSECAWPYTRRQLGGNQRRLSSCFGRSLRALLSGKKKAPFFKGGGGWPPPPPCAEYLQTPKKNCWSKLIGAESARENF